jgi:hypothetical protein
MDALVLRAYRENQVFQGFLALTDLQVKLVFKALQVLQELRVQLVHEEIQEEKQEHLDNQG